MQRGSITRAVEGWLPDALDGADGVRREVALRLAAELDTGSTPAHAVPRLANALGTLLAAIEADVESPPTGELDVRRLLEEVLR